MVSDRASRYRIASDTFSKISNRYGDTQLVHGEQWSYGDRN